MLHSFYPNIVFLYILLSYMGSACTKKTKNSSPQPQHPVPYVPVNLTIYPNDPQYAPFLQNPGGWIYINGAGLYGIVLYKKSQQDFVALERASSVYPNNANAKVWVQNDNFTLKDTISKATWQIVDGAPIQGSPWNLRQYATSYDGNKLVIYN